MSFSNKTDSEVFDVLFNLAVRLLQSGRYIDGNSLYSLNSDKDEKSILQMMFVRQAMLSSRVNLKMLPMEMIYNSLCRNALYAGMYVQDYLDTNDFTELDLSPEELDEFLFTVNHSVNASRLNICIDGGYNFKFNVPSSEFSEMLEESPYFTDNVNRIVAIITNALKEQVGSSATEDKYIMMMLSLFLKIGVTLYYSICNQ